MMLTTRLVVAASAAFLASAATAGDKFWVGPLNGGWLDPANWSLTAGGAGGAGVPAVLDEVYIAAGEGETVTVELDGPATAQIHELNMHGPGEVELVIGDHILNMDEAWIGLVGGAPMLTMTGGELNATEFVRLASHTDAVCDIRGGTIDAGGIYFGYFGNATVNQTGGTVRSDTFVEVGLSGSSTSTYTFDDGLIEAGNLRVGAGGTGTFIQRGGAVDVISFISGSSNTGGTGTTIIEAGTFDAFNGFLGWLSPATFDVIGGSVAFETSLRLGNDGGESATFNAIGGTVDIGTALFVSEDGPTRFDVSGSDVTAGELRVFYGGSTAIDFIMSGGSFTVGPVSNSGSLGVHGGVFESGDIDNDHTIGVDGSTTTFRAASIDNAYLLAISNDATVELTSGPLLNNQFLFGTGTIVGDVINNASIHAGGSGGLGSMTIDGNVTMAGLLRFEIGASGFDTLDVTTPLALAGTLDVQSFGDYVPDDGASYTLLQAPSLSGAFDTVTVPNARYVVVQNADSIVVQIQDIPGDLDGDGTVGTTDMLEMIGSWGPCVDCPADLDGDGFVNTVDLLLLLGNWG